jgi:hypothetical protein
MRALALGPLQRGWRRLSAGTRAEAVTMVLAAVALLGLLLAFHEVVRGAVVRGESRRAAVAAREVAAWRCTTLPAAPLRNDCRASLDNAPAVAQAVPNRR